MHINTLPICFSPQLAPGTSWHLVFSESGLPTYKFLSFQPTFTLLKNIWNWRDIMYRYVYCIMLYIFVPRYGLNLRLDSFGNSSFEVPSAVSRGACAIHWYILEHWTLKTCWGKVKEYFVLRGPRFFSTCSHGMKSDCTISIDKKAKRQEKARVFKTRQ